MVTTALEILGLVLIVAGAGLVFFPAGLICAGLALVLVGYLIGRQ